VALNIYVDGDACPVKDEVYRVARRLRVPVTVVANNGLRLPVDPLFSLVVVDDKADAADDYIAERAGPQSIVITADIPLADRCLKAGAAVIAPNGRPFTEASIGSAMAMRSLMQDLRAGGEQIGGPRPFEKRDRSQFLQALDAAIVRLKRG
jgi:uncharacterized protein YaiI (UPF0178 family)